MDRPGRSRGRGRDDGGGHRGRHQGNRGRASGGYRGDYQGGSGGDGGGYQGGSQGGSGGGGGSQRDYQGGGGGGRSRGPRAGYRGAATGGPRNRVFSIPGHTTQTDAAIATLEDSAMTQQTSSADAIGARLTSMDLKTKDVAHDAFPYRPAYGTAGSAVNLWANYFPFTVKSPKVYRYEVICKDAAPKTGQDQSHRGKGKGPQGEEDEDEEEDASDIRGRKLHLAFQGLIAVLGPLNKDVGIASQFKSQIISSAPLDLPENPIFLDVEPENPGSSPDKIKVTIKPPTEVRMGDIQSFVLSMNGDHGGRAIYPKFPEVVDALDVILGHTAKSNLDQIVALGGSRFFPITNVERIELLQSGRPLEARRGFFQSARLATGRLLLNANVTHGVFSRPGQVSDLMNRCGVHPARCGDDRLTKRAEAFSRCLPRTRVCITFPTKAGNVTTKYRILHSIFRRPSGNGNDQTPPGVGVASGCEFPGPRDLTFTPKGANRATSVFEYFRSAHNHTCQDLPVLNVGSKGNPEFVPAELVQILEGQSVKTKLTGEETTAMLKFACRVPFLNASSICEDSRRVLGHDDNAFLDKFGISIQKQLAVAPARRLNAPMLKYLDREGKRDSTKGTTSGAWNMSQARLVKPGTLIKRWTYVTITNNDGAPSASGAISEHVMTRFATWMQTEMGVPIVPRAIAIPENHMTKAQASAGNQLDLFFARAKESLIQHIMVVLCEKDSGALYAKIKRLGDCQYGIHTNCLVKSSFVPEGGKNNAAYFANVGLKINLKAGGVNHKLIQEPRLMSEGKTMIAGYDVTHPTNMNVPKDQEPPSLVGLVASVDKDWGQWPAFTWEQKSRTEMLTGKLIEAFDSRLQLWQKASGKQLLPENIVIYRDGVSEGQFSKVVEEELPSIRTACQQRYRKYRKPPPKITLVVSVKRHHTRFYPTDGEQMTSSGNILAGTVVDRGVTMAAYWDFFLTPHFALQGTARPAHYLVLLDEIFRSKFGKDAANELERLTHDLCYLFGRATKAVSICPPAYYADIVCERARAHRPAYDGTDTASVSSSAATGSAATGSAATGSAATGSAAAAASVQVHEKLKDSMYYI